MIAVKETKANILELYPHLVELNENTLATRVSNEFSRTLILIRENGIALVEQKLNSEQTLVDTVSMVPADIIKCVIFEENLKSTETSDTE